VLVAGRAKSAATLAVTDVPTTVDFPGSDGTRAYGINKAGDIVGTYELRDPAVVVHSHGFLLANGHFTTIDFPGGFGTEAYGINAAGEIVGVYWEKQGKRVSRASWIPDERRPVQAHRWPARGCHPSPSPWDQRWR
jgi:uncharacterized membrane protein